MIGDNLGYQGDGKISDGYHGDVDMLMFPHQQVCEIDVHSFYLASYIAQSNAFTAFK